MSTEYSEYLKKNPQLFENDEYQDLPENTFENKLIDELRAVRHSVDNFKILKVNQDQRYIEILEKIKGTLIGFSISWAFFIISIFFLR